MSYKIFLDTQLHAGGIFYLHKESRRTSDYIDVYCRKCKLGGAIHKSKITSAGTANCVICKRILVSHVKDKVSNV